MRVKLNQITISWHTDSEAMADECEDVCSQEECEMPSAVAIFLELVNYDNEMVDDFHCHTCIDHIDGALQVASSVQKKLWLNDRNMPSSE